MSHPTSGDDGSTPSQPLEQLQAIPPPPPLPPLPRRNMRISSPDGVPFKTDRTQNLAAGNTVMMASDNVYGVNRPFVPCHMFFYGSLMDPEVLQTILGLSDAPNIGRGTVRGFAVKMWGIYPALVPCKEGGVQGTVWKVNSEAHFLRLAAYETAAYTWCECTVALDNGEIIPGCRTFCWAGDANSKDLEEGTFDLERYQKYFKPSVVRRGL